MSNASKEYQEELEKRAREFFRGITPMTYDEMAKLVKSASVNEKGGEDGKTNEG